MKSDEFDLFKTDSPHSLDEERDNQVYPPSETKKNGLSSVATLEEAVPLILVIDDDPGIRDALAYVLEEEYRLLFCANGDDGIQAVNAEVSAVVLDIKMQGKDGFETFTEIKRKFSHLPIIFHSAYQNLKDPYDVMNKFRPFGYIRKEGGTRELMDTLASAVDYYRQILKNAVLVRELQKFNQTLETQIVERTQKLQEALSQLEKQHQQLKQTQSQLVQAEKMAGLGTLVAGIAHEINNPINFIYIGGCNLEKKLQEFQTALLQLVEEGDSEIIEYFDQQFGGFQVSLQGVAEGSKRIKTIVEDLRTFSRLDEADKKTVDLMASLESTLRLIQTRYEKSTDFIYEFEDRPMLECYPAKLNQLFMNIIVNSCEAIEQKQRQMGDSTKGSITICGTIKNKELHISFQDTGIGMSRQVKEKMFEPFFTTKRVGEGTGMGMSIAYGIIEQHQGQIEVESEEGKGTTITIQLPLERE